MSKKVLSLLLTAVMALSLFAGFSALAEEEPVTITYWGWDVSNFAQPQMDAYIKLHPNVTFEPVAVEWGDMLTKVQQALASNSELPVIVPMDLALLGSWANFGIFEDLTEYGLDPSHYSQALMDTTTDADGKIFGLHESLVPAGIAYKRDLALKYFGTDDPEELHAMFSTYEDYVTKGKELAEATDGKVFLFHSGQAVAEWFYFASYVANTDGNKTINATEKYSDILSKLIALRDVGAVDTYQNGTPEGNATYSDDAHIFYPCPDWAITYYIKANDPDGAGNWGIMQAPVDYQHGGTAMGITSASTDAQKAVAYDFITFCISTLEGATVMKNNAGYITHDQNIIADGTFAKRADEDFFGGQDISTLYYKTIAAGLHFMPPTPYDNDIINTRNDIAQLVMNDPSVDLDTAVSAAIEELSQFITDPDVVIE